MKLYRLFLILCISQLSAEIKEAVWTEYKEPSEKRLIDYHGNINLGSQIVKDVVGEEKTTLTTNLNLNLNKSFGQHTSLKTELRVDNFKLTTGSDEKYNINFYLKTHVIEANLGGDISNILNIVNRMNYQNKLRSLKFGFKFNKFENFPISFSYLNNSNISSQGGSSEQVLLTEQADVSLGSKIWKVHTNLSGGISAVSNSAGDLKTTNKNIKIDTNIPLVKTLQLNFGFQPTISETLFKNNPYKLISQSINTLFGFSFQPLSTLRLVTNLNLNNAYYTTNYTTTTTRTTISQIFNIFYQPSQRLSFSVDTNFSDTKNANKSKTVVGRINYTVANKLLGPTKLESQYTEVNDNTDKKQMESNSYILETSFNFTKNIILSVNAIRTLHRDVMIASRSSINTSSNFTFSHKISQSLNYALGYDFIISEINNTISTTNGYNGSINYNLKKDIPISLKHTISSSKNEQRKVSTYKTQASVKLPIKSFLSTSYSINVYYTKTEKLILKYDENIQHNVDLEFRFKKFPMQINTGFKFITGSINVNTTSLALNYKFVENIFLNINFLNNTNPSITNMFLGIMYKF